MILKDAQSGILPEETTLIAERVLSGRWGAMVELAQERSLNRSTRSQVHRYAVRSELPDLPKRVIVKRAVTEGSEPYQPDEPHGSAWRLLNDWAGLQFLTALAGPASPAPQFYGGDREAGLIVMEDIGPSTQLDDLLLGEDRAAAVDGLMTFMAVLGRMHAMTIGQRAAFDQLRNSLGPRQDDPQPQPAAEALKREIRKLAEAAGVRHRPGIEADFKDLELFQEEDGPFMAYSHCDLCLDNCLLAGSQAKLLDFEFGSYRHALLDAVYGRTHFPTCWHVNRLPTWICEQMEEAYRGELAQGCPEACDADLFESAVVEACAWQVLSTLSIKLLEKDAQLGGSTMRQRTLARLDRFAEVSAAAGHLEPLGSTARDLAASLRQQWPTEVVPLYPAFR